MYPADTEVGQNLAALDAALAKASLTESTADTDEEEIKEDEQDSDPLDEEINKAIITLVDEFELADAGVRKKMLHLWKKCELYWNDIQSAIWDETGGYRSLQDTLNLLSERQEDFDPYYYDKIVNIFKAMGESVIAALSQEVPPVIFPPDDADNPNDVTTSKGYTKISELIAKHNQAPMLLAKALYFLWNNGLVGGYTYTKESYEYGTIKKPKYELQEEDVNSYSCPICGGPLDGAPDVDGLMPCPNCGQEVPPEVEPTKIKVPRLVGHDDAPKTRECIELYGPTEFFIPHYVRDQKKAPICILKTDCHYTYAQEIYENIADRILGGQDNELYERWARSHSEAMGDDEGDQVTIKRVWLRPWAFNKFRQSNEALWKEVRRRYPDGVFAAIVNEIVAEKENESLDDCWTFSVNPLSSHLHARPLGASLLPIQDITNEVVLLQLQSIEYGIPITFGEASALNWETFGKTRAKPGDIFPASGQAGQGLDKSFSTLKTAVFPKESIDYRQGLDKDGQFVSGAFPSIYGGQLSGGGKTAAEYNMSRNQALQRLSITWKFLSWWWANTISKSVRAFHQNLMANKVDEKIPTKRGNTWENVWIRREELLGKVGEVEPEIGDGFPQSWAQKKDLIIQLLTMNNEAINAALFHPENTGILAQTLGFREFYIPGDDDRNKQLIEISLLLESEPMDMEGMLSSIPVDPELDNHDIELQSCLTWMKSDQGLDAKVNNPAGFANVRAHAKEHQAILQQIQMAQQEQQENPGEGEENDSKNNSTDSLPD